MANVLEQAIMKKHFLNRNTNKKMFQKKINRIQADLEKR